MCPRLSQLNSSDLNLANAIDLGKRLLSKLGRSDSFNVRFSKLGVVMFFAFFVVCAVPTFVHHISNVIGMSAHGEMSGVAAGRVVTRMHDLHSNGDHDFVFNHPRNSIGKVHFSFVVMNAKLPLPVFVSGGSPWPAFIGRRLVNFRPESNKKLFVKHEATYKEMRVYSS